MRSRGRRSVTMSTESVLLSTALSSSSVAEAVLLTSRGMRARRDVVGDRDRLRLARAEVGSVQCERLARRAAAEVTGVIESTISRGSTVSVRMTLSASEKPVFVTSIVNVCARAAGRDRVAESNVFVTERSTSS